MTEGTCVRPLGDVCDILDSRRKPITKRNRVPGPYPYYGATGVLDYVESYIFDEPLVLIGEDGAKWGAGEPTAYAVEGKYWVNNHAHVIRPNRDLMLDSWVIYYLNAIDLAPFISGLTVPKLNQGRLREIPIPLPTLAEQKRIVAILDEAFAGIATAVANTERNVANARELFESYLTLVLLDKQWEWKRLGDLCRGFEYGSSAKSKKDGMVPVVRMGNIQGGQISWQDLVYSDSRDEIKRYLLKHNDVLFNRTNSPELVGKTAVYKGERPAIFAGYLIRVNRIDDQLDADYLNYFLNSKIAFDHGKSVVTSSVNQANINATKLSDYPIPAPPLAEQQRIVGGLNELWGEIQRINRIYQQKSAALAELRQSLLQKAFAGELTAVPQDEIETALA